MAPVVALDYTTGSWLKAVPRRRTEGALEVLHPRWMYVPGTGAVTALLLFAELLGPVRRLRREFPFEVIDAHFGYPEGIAAALLAMVTGTPFSITLRGAELLHSRYRLRRRWMRWSMRRAQRVITVSEELRRLAISLGVAEEDTCVIPNGLDSDIYYRRDRAAMRRKHGLCSDKKLILTAGHLIELKGHHRAVEALAQLRAMGVEADLLIAGGNPGPGLRSHEPHIRQAIEALGLQGQVRLLGHVPAGTLAELMCAADLFCLASSREGWPNVVQEALGCGTPVVATRVGAVPEILTSPDLGLVVEPGDAGALAKGWKIALERDWDTERITSWARSRTWSHVAGEVLEQMRHIVAAARKTI